MKREMNIILISMDTVRADHLSCYGYDRKTTPNIDTMAEQDGVVYENAFSTAVWTPPGHASMLTGLYPAEHGVVDRNSLSPKIKTIAELLEQEGYNTGGFVNNSQVGELVGFERGHQTFSEVWQGYTPKNLVDRGFQYIGRTVKRKLGFSDHGAQKTNQLIFEWLNQNKGNRQPFYMFAHYIDVHNPLIPPAKYKKVFRQSYPGNDKNKVALMAHNPLNFYTKKILLNENENKELIDLYDSELLYVDSKIGELIDYLKAEGMYDNTMIVITADHGEQFGENSQYSHVQSLYNPVIKIPLIIKYPQSIRLKGKENKVAQLIDILPTIFGQIGLETNLEYTLQGMNLNSTAERKYGFAEWEGRIPFFILNDLKCDENDPRVQNFKNKKWSIFNDRMKLIYTEQGDYELYEYAVDHEEKKNIFNPTDDKYDDMKASLHQYIDNSKRIYDDDLEYGENEKVMENLKALGYI